MTRRADIENLVALGLKRYGRLDVLVSNDGIGPISRFDDLMVEDREAMIDLNIKGVLYGMAAALPLFRRQGSGHFVHVVSTATAPSRTRSMSGGCGRQRNRRAADGAALVGAVATGLSRGLPE